MPTFEFRRLLRANAVLKVSYKVSKALVVEGIAYSKNISSTGINIIMPHALEKGDRIEMHIHVFEKERPVLAKGKIVWQSSCAYVPTSKKKYYSTGIQFSYMSSEDAIKTSDFVRDVLQKQSQERIKQIIETLEKNQSS
ncbi:PilZ domain-containing protein [Candidatus Omnitrophota bacterium]